MKDASLLFQKGLEVRKNAYAPYSKFLVGSCIESSEGNLFIGCNVENASYSVGICAEANAIGAMIAAGNVKIKQIVIVADTQGVTAPCGACRQRILELGSADTVVHLFNLHEEHEVYKISDLLPHAFVSSHLTRISK